MTVNTSTASAPTQPTETQLFRSAMASFPSGVTIVTTTDADGRWWGFTASSFCSVSMDPPLVLVCLADTAECHPVFTAAQRWMIHVIHPDHAELATRFATRGADKFTHAGFVPDERGLPVLTDACVTLDCTASARHAGGDHTILVGRVEHTSVREAEPAIYFQRAFRMLA
ncbi:flavin reductase family protein [Rhodococcus pyridinivorans]|uniref:flavin reductase family protein n=1 Tax=Rhodococcus TaxID=1827 RepID=UPI001C7CA3EF|nr:flavin reductase family protein [Rhodococcus sp. DMU2021]MBX4171479.1 flavin reductase family protein [Rhodococcus sp. DMU2021]